MMNPKIIQATGSHNLICSLILRSYFILNLWIIMVRCKIFSNVCIWRFRGLTGVLSFCIFISTLVMATKEWRSQKLEIVPHYKVFGCHSAADSSGNPLVRSRKGTMPMIEVVEGGED